MCLALLSATAVVMSTMAVSPAAYADPDRSAAPAGSGTTVPARVDDLLATDGVPGLTPREHQVTLITGDRVTLRVYGEGGPYDVDLVAAPRPDRPVTFLAQVAPDGVYVIPSDVQAAVAAGRVDRALFNVTYLVEQGYADAESDHLPVIVGYPRQARAELRGAARPSAAELASRADRLPATTDAVGLASVNGAGVSVAKARAAEFWRELGLTTDDRPLSQRPRLWLDHTAQLVLEDSVPLIGAPQAWAAGYDGSGVTVAVLDSGVDLGHPDLAGKVAVAESFVDGAPAQDGHGHGTHVASTIAGSGAASDGRHIGVAPGATLISGRVCTDAGSCPFSSMIAGMEWATLQMGADIVSFSIGGQPTDGTDPLSQAVNELTAATGALFVVAAGNRGSGELTVSSPGAADAALTVAATDKTDRPANFSSRGPRWGDLALKPDIAAPGVGIVAARAAGTTMGTAVDAWYTRANGTSMATPHVSGAAAILAQRYPDWTAAQLKAALMSTATDAGLTVYQQGAGRLDVARVATQQVFATTPNLDFRNVPIPVDGEPEPGPITRQVTYANHSDQPVTLTLTVGLTTASGAAVPAGTVTAPATVTVPAHGEATVPVTVNVAGLGANRYTGALVATDPATGTRLRTPVGLVREAPKATLTIRTIGRDGQPVSVGSAHVLDVAGSQGFITEMQQVADGVLQVRLPEGVYHVAQVVDWLDEETRLNLAWLFDPEVVVDGDTEIVLDARTASQVTFDTPRPSEPLSNVWDAWYQRTNVEGGQFAGFILHDLATGGAWRKLWATPTRPVTVGEFRFVHQWLTGKAAVDMTVLGPHQRELHVAAAPFALTRGAVGCSQDDSCVPTYRSGGTLFLHHDYVPFDGTEVLELVDGGQARPEDLAGRDLTGKLALLEYRPIGCEINVDDLHALRDAGAAAVLAFPATTSSCPIPTVVTQPQFTGPPRPIGIRFAFLPVPEGLELREQLAREPVRIRVTGTPETPYVNFLKPYEHGRVPESLHYRYTEMDLAIRDLYFHAAEPTGFDTNHRVWKQDDLLVLPLSLAHGAAFVGPHTVREYMGPIDPEVIHNRQVAAGAADVGRMATVDTVEVLDRPVRTDLHLNTVPLAPGAVVAPDHAYRVVNPDRSMTGVWGIGNYTCTICREGDFMVLLNSMVTGAPHQQRNNGSNPDALGAASYRLFRDGQEIPPLTDSGGIHIYQFPTGAGTYRLELDVAEGVERFFPRTEAAWTFRSAPPTEEAARRYGYACLARDLLQLHSGACAPVPAVFVSYDLAESLALDNTVKAPGAQWIDVYAYHHPSPLASPRIAGLKLWASYDGGQHWTQAQVRDEGDGHFRVKLVHPPSQKRPGDRVTLKVEAWDVDGNRLEQVTYDAFRLRDAGAQATGDLSLTR